LWRRPLETLLVCLATTAAFALLGLMVGLYVHTQRIVHEQRMDRLFVVQRFPDRPYTGLPIALENQIAGIDGVTGVGTTHNVFGYHLDPHDGVGVMAVDEGILQGWPEAPLTQSQLQTLMARPEGIYFSRKAAAHWKVKPGDRFSVTVSPSIRADGNPTWVFEVLDIVPDAPIWDGNLILGNYHYIDNSEPPQSQGLGNTFFVAVKDAARGHEISHSIDRHFANSGSPTFSVPQREDAEGLVNSSVNIADVTLSVGGAGLFMIVFLIANAIMRSVRERIPEFAVLMTVGFRRTQLGWLVVAEAAVPCLLGALLGTGVAALVARIPAQILSRDLRQLVSNSDTPPAVLGVALGLALILALASAAAPLQRLRHISVTDALAGR
ncbi:MAG TPA: ABC transporter permease, partial [Acidobacteriaceae bacterium]